MSADFVTIAGVVVVIATVIAIARGVDVRLALLLGAFALCSLAGNPALMLIKFFNTLADERYIIPICSAMGFAYVLRESGCDQHMVHMLIQPVKRIRPLLIPGAVAVGFLVNIAIISQASTAVAVGMVIIPLLRSAGLSPAAVGSALLLGASIGGELLNPGAPEVVTVAERLTEMFGHPVDPRTMQPVIAPLLAIQWVVATAILWWNIRREPYCESNPEHVHVAFEWKFRKAIVPLIPLAFLMMAGPPLHLFHIPREWLLQSSGDAKVLADTYSSRLIGLAMLFGTVEAVIVVPSTAKKAAKAFFEGAGYALTTIVSVIVAANCFGEGIKALKMADWIGGLTKDRPRLVWPLAGAGALAFAIICGSGMATTQSLYRFFALEDASEATNLRIGAVVSIAAAAGRTTSPAAAVVLLCASLVGVPTWDLLRRVFFPLFAATCVMVAAAVFMH